MFMFLNTSPYCDAKKRIVFLLIFFLSNVQFKAQLCLYIRFNFSETRSMNLGVIDYFFKVSLIRGFVMSYSRQFF